ncbi:hypothetical protein B0H66DRAFT_374601 [Apodospora peruviana]|uniref:Protein kinase domain-containing protein n=1 Tax=Apodospora peruviana TaxID=516989 RepID=A0AAE0HWL9_9PEZI|nr:hypothetical protein B0H66DRAFT_374601 [Apodospora peruviana]
MTTSSFDIQQFKPVVPTLPGEDFWHVGIHIPIEEYRDDDPQRPDGSESDKWLDEHSSGFLLVSRLRATSYVFSDPVTNELFFNKHCRTFPNPNTGVKGVPNEIFYSRLDDHNTSFRLPDESHFPKLLAYGIDVGDGTQEYEEEYGRLFSMYFEWLNGNNLDNFLSQFAGIAGCIPQARLPEIFIWRVLQQLGYALLWMQSGVTAEQFRQHGLSQVPADPRRIVHGDIKLTNIMLNFPEDLTSPSNTGLEEGGFPRIVLCNFGSARVIIAESDHNQGGELVDIVDKQTDIATSRWDTRKAPLQDDVDLVYDNEPSVQELPHPESPDSDTDSDSRTEFCPSLYSDRFQFGEVLRELVMAGEIPLRYHTEPYPSLAPYLSTSDDEALANLYSDDLIRLLMHWESEPLIRGDNFFWPEAQEMIPSFEFLFEVALPMAQRKVKEYVVRLSSGPPGSLDQGLDLRLINQVKPDEDVLMPLRVEKEGEEKLQVIATRMMNDMEFEGTWKLVEVKYRGPIAVNGQLLEPMGKLADQRPSPKPVESGYFEGSQFKVSKVPDHEYDFERRRKRRRQENFSTTWLDFRNMAYEYLEQD